jgi:hypothetical protein
MRGGRGGVVEFRSDWFLFPFVHPTTIIETASTFVCETAIYSIIIMSFILSNTCDHGHMRKYDIDRLLLQKGLIFALSHQWVCVRE